MSLILEEQTTPQRFFQAFLLLVEAGGKNLVLVTQLRPETEVSGDI